MLSCEKTSLWKGLLELCGQVRAITAKFPKCEWWSGGLVSQLLRAADSALSNYSEGYARRTSADFLHYISITRGSLFEVNAQLSIAEYVGYVESVQKAKDLIEHLVYQLNNLKAKKEADVQHEGR